MNQSRLTDLFNRYFEKKATQEEIETLFRWLSQQKDGESIKALMDNAWENFRDEGVIFTEQQSEAIIKHILDTSHEPDEFPRVAPKKKRHPLKIALMVVALLGLSLAGYFYFSPAKHNNKIAKNNAAIKNDIAPGGSKAILTLANGKTIALDSTEDGSLGRQGPARIVKSGKGQLIYQTQDNGKSAPAEIAYNTLTTPRGGQYQLVLPDGSKVWLNAASSLKYPTAFTGSDRKVELSGEAYFEIAKDASKPFYVNISSGQKDRAISVEVLGTHFDIKAYDDEPSTKTTLLEGAVKISHQQESKILKPNEQATIRSDASAISVEKVDTRNVIAWKDGLFYFANDDVGTIMRKIARWYDVAVVYEKGIPPGHYTGIIGRNNNLSAVLKMLELSGLHFELENKRIIVKP